MDAFNNDRGQTAADVLIDGKRWSLKNIEGKGLQELQAKQLKVLKPGLPIPKEPQ